MSRWYEVHVALLRRADQIEYLRRGARRHASRDSAEMEAREIRGTFSSMCCPIVVEVRGCAVEAAR